MQLALCFDGNCPQPPASLTSCSSTSPCSWQALPDGSSSRQPINVTLDQMGQTAMASTTIDGVGINLVAGDAQVSATDVSLSGSARTTLSLTRQLNSVTASGGTVNGMFGPGWSAGLPVASGGADWVRLVDTGSVYTVYRPDQSIVTFTLADAVTSTYRPNGDAVDSGYRVTPSASADCPNATSGVRCLTLTDADGVATVFVSASGAPAAGSQVSPQTYTLTKVSEPGNVTATSLTYDSTKQPGSAAAADPTNRPTRITSPWPSGGSCTDPSAANTWSPGCRALDLTYDRASGLLQKVTYDTSDGSSPLRVDVACYGYDGSGRLSDAWDPRNVPSAASTGQAITCGSTPIRGTHYTYDGTSSRIQSMTPAWSVAAGASIGTSSLAATSLGYDVNGKVSTIGRAHANGSGSETYRIDYTVSTTPDPANPGFRPDLTPAAVATWGQVDLPRTGTVICAPSSNVFSLDATRDLTPCSITYLNVNGRAVNTANYSGSGSSGWHVATTEYDWSGRVTRSLSAVNREEALSPTTGAGAALGLPTDTATAATALSTVNKYAPNTNATDGASDLTDTFGPYHQVMLSSGTLANVRAHTHLSYDVGNEPGHPVNSGSLHLVVDAVTGASQSITSQSTNETDTRETSAYYSIRDGSIPTDRQDAGWNFRRPMMTVVDPGTGHLNITRETVLDPGTGDVVQLRMPVDAASLNPGTTAGTTLSVYYSATAMTGADSDCGNNAGNDGLLCKTYPASNNPSAPTGGVTAPALVTTKYAYDAFRRVTSKTETPAGDPSHARTTTSIYGFNSSVTAGTSSNPWATTLTQSSTAGGLGNPVTPQSFTYDSGTGLLTGVTGSGITDARGYDDFGRQISYAENVAVSSPTATVTYAPTTGLVTQTTDAHRTTTYGYNAGGERRGLATSMTVSVNSSPVWSGTYTAAFDANAAIVSGSDANGVSGPPISGPSRLRVWDQVRGPV